LKLYRHERSSIAFETPRELDEAMARENREGSLQVLSAARRDRSEPPGAS
jgi:hypothetical protein